MKKPAGAARVTHAEPSFAQERLWFIEQLRPSTGMSNVPLTIRVQEPLTAADVRHALELVVARHESLRTRFISVGGAPVQEIRAETLFSVDVVDLRDEPQDVDHRRTEEALRQLAAAPIALDRSPLFRVQMILGRDGGTVIQLVMHHIITDGWSLGVLQRDLSAAINGTFEDLPPLAFQYREVASRQRAELAAGEYDADLRYWGEALKDRQMLALPLLGGEPRTTAVHGAREVLTLDDALSARVWESATRRRLTPNMLMLAAYNVVLFRHTGEDSAVLSIGTPTAGRWASGDEQLIGFFVNTLPVTTRLSRDMPVSEFLTRVRTSVLGALSHQRVPFERIVELVQPERRLEHSPLYQTIFVYQNAPSSAAPFGGRRIETLDVHNGASPGGLTMSVSERDGRLSCRLEYNSEQMAADTARRLLRRYRTVLETMVDDGHDDEYTIGSIPLLDEAELGEMTAIGARAAYDGPPTEDLFSAFLEVVRRRPDAVAITAQDGDLTYAELASQADDLAELLIQRGVGPGDWVAVRLNRSTFLPVTLLAVLRAGAGYVPLPPALPVARIKFMLSDCAPTALVTEASLAEDARAGCATVLREDFQTHPTHSVSACAVPISTYAYLIYTSGSTGVPKGVPVSHANARRLFTATDQLFDLDEHDVWTFFHSYAFDFSVWELWGALLHGARCVLVAEETASRPSDFRELLRAEGVTVLSQTPSAFALLDEADAHADGDLHVRYVVFGGERLEPSALTRWAERYPLDAVRLINMYGITETTVHVTFREMTPDDLRRPGISPIGRALHDLDLHMLEPDSSAPVPYGVPGEICVGGAGVTSGYLNRPERTARSFVPHPFAPGEVLYRSGDQGIVLPEGEHLYLGRYDHQVQVRGFRIELGEVEAALLACPGVQRAAVSLVDADTDRARLTAHVVAELDVAPVSVPSARGREWESIFDATYSADDGENRAELRGWRSSYTGERIPAAQMDEWINTTLADIRALRPQRVLEIGVGTGMLLTRLLDEVEFYTATDVSAEAIERLGHMKGPRVRLLHRDASDLDGLEREFDTVIINSVIQYFPDAEYAQDVIHAAARLVRPGGHVFVGDVRDLRSHEIFHRSLAVASLDPRTSARQALAEADLSRTRDRELVLDPSFFSHLMSCDSGITGVVVRPRMGECINEMSKYRYNAILTVENDDPRSGPEPAESGPVPDVESLDVLLAAHPAGPLVVRGLTDSRLVPDSVTSQYLEDPATETLEQAHGQAVVEPRGMSPGEAVHAVTAHGRTASVTLSAAGPGYFDLFVDAASADEQWMIDASEVGGTANDPTVCDRQDALSAWLRTLLSQELPEYMLPATITIVPRIPLTINGKVDRDALPRRAESKHTVLERGHRDPVLRTGTERAVADLFTSLLHLRQVGADDDFFALGGHSLLVARFAFAVSDRFGVELPLRAVFENPTVRGIARAIDQGRSGEIVESPDFEADATRWTPPVRRTGARRRASSPAPADTVLMTGATGFLGAHMLAELLASTDARAHCVVRARDEAQAQERVVSALRRYELPLAGLDRLEVHAGELASSRLGLPSRTYERLADEVGLVYHAAADTTLVAPYSRLREINVEGTSRVIEFASVSGAAAHCVSTIGVFAPSDEVVHERSATGPVERLTTAYAQSKWVAERRMLLSCAEGLPISIYRPSRIVGSTRTGACRPDDLFWRVVLGAIELGQVPVDLPVSADMVAVDEVASSIVRLSAEPGPGTFHLTGETRVPLSAAAHVLEQCGYRLRATTFAEWLGDVSDDPGNTAMPLVPMLAHQGHVDVVASSEETRQALTRVGAGLSPITEDMLTRTVEYFIRHGDFPRPGGRSAS